MVEVTEEVSAPLSEERSEAGELFANTSFIDSSSERCRSRYTLKLLDAHPPVRIICDKVDPEFNIAVDAPRLKQWDEYLSASGTSNLAKKARRIREKFSPGARGKGELLVRYGPETPSKSGE